MHRFSSPSVLVLLLSAIVFCTGTINAVNKLVPFRKKKIWGYCQYGNPSKLIIQPKYERAFQFAGAVAIVETVDDKALLIDTTGKILKVLPFRLNDYLDNYYWLRVSAPNGKTGVINLQGKFVIQPLYEQVAVLGPDSFEVHNNGKIGTVNKAGKILRKFIPDESDGMSEMLTMGSVNACPEKPCFAGNYAESMALIVHKGKYGYIRPDTTIVIECKYSMAANFHMGLARVLYETPGQKHEPSYKDKNGFEVVQALTLEAGYVDSVGREYWED